MQEIKLSVDELLTIAAAAGVVFPHMTNTSNPIDFPKGSALSERPGDLIKLAQQGEFDVIVQGCNCFNTMGSGIAKQIREQLPAAYDIDQTTEAGDINKLGNYTTADIQSGDTEFTVVNAYTQYDFNKNGDKTDRFEYASFEVILRKLEIRAGSCRFGFPMIGMGLAGGDKARIMKLLEAFAIRVNAQGGQVTLVKFA